MDQPFGFNSPAMGGPAPFGSAPSRLAKPRFTKKKYAPPNLSIGFENDDRSFNPFRPVSPPEDTSGVVNPGPSDSNADVYRNVGFAFGASKASTNGNPFPSAFASNPFSPKVDTNSHGIIEPDKDLVGEMRNLRIESQQQHINDPGNMNGKETGNSETKGIDELLASKLPEEVENKLKIKSEGNTDSLKFKLSGSSKLHDSFVSGGNVDGGAERMELLNEMNKLNIKDGATDQLKNPAFEGVESFGRTSDNELHDRLKDLHLKETMNPNLGNDNVNVGGCGNSVIQSDDINNSQHGGLSDQVQKDLPPFTKTANEMETEIFGSKNSIFSCSVPPELNFQAERSEVSSSGQSSIMLSCSPNYAQPSIFGPESPFMDRTGKTVDFSFSGMMQHAEFKTPNSKGSLNRKIETKRDPTKDTKLKKKKWKHRKSISISIPMNIGQGYFRTDSWEENVESSEAYSPMDISPYQETPAENSRETSVTSDEALSLNDNYASSESHPMVSNDIADEDLIDATRDLNINENNVKYNEKEKVEPLHFHPSVCVEEGYISGAETESFLSATDQLDRCTDSFVTAAENEVSSSSTVERQDINGGNTNLEDTCQSKFIFAASPTAQCQSPLVTRHQKKKNHARYGSDLSNSVSSAKVPYSPFSLSSFQVSGASSLSLNKTKKVDMPAFSRQSPGTSQPVNEKEVKLEANSTTAQSMAALEACEKWRLRGNQAYASGDLSRAEDYYTQGANCISQRETSRNALQALTLCYSNRAATRMSLGRMKEALDDCLTAIRLDPNFLKAQLRAANCYLSLGETENASRHFMKCLEMGSKSCVERKVLEDASEGLEKALKVSECMKQSATLLGRRMSNDAVCALAVIADALVISPCSEKLLEMKADALLMLRKYEEVIQLCELTLASADLNAFRTDVDLKMLDASKIQNTASFRLWCCSVTVKAYFYLGKLEEAVNFLNKEEKSMPSMESGGTFALESSIPLAATIRELLRLKAAGNEAFQSGKHAEAIEHYSAAISCNVESRPFAAICFCNRAAAYRAVGQILDAIADCSLSIALDGNYVKAISRRASLLEMIRDYGQAASDLRRLISLLTRQMENKINQSDKSFFMSEIRQRQQKLLTMEEEDRKEIPLNMYLILGVDPSASSSEIKRAYRKAALKHHPDKAGQLLSKNDNADDGTWKEIAEEVSRDADRLFKMIGEAYALLSDPAKRSRYDLEEETRNSLNRGNRGNTMKTHMDSHNYQFERSVNRWQRSDIWRAFGNYQPRESERSHSNWYS
nr:tpr repeat-containing thioredoxin ttl1 [Ipomoea batatas]